MATLAFGIAGTAAVPTGASATTAALITGLFTAAGALVDQYLIYPRLAPAERVVGPRLDDIHVQTASEGSPVRRCYGPENRTAGTIIWLGQREEHSQEAQADSGGGCGGPGRNVETYTYFQDVAIGICEGECPANAIQQIWAEGKRVFNRVGNLTIVSNQISVSAVTQTQPGPPRAFAQIRSTGPDLTQFKAGQTISISGFVASGGANNGLYMVNRVWSSGGNTFMDVANAGRVTEAAGPAVTLFQPQPQLDTSLVKGFTFYPGSKTQGADPIIQAAEGAANTPAFRGLAYIVLEDVALNEFSGRMPQFEFVLQGDQSLSVRGCLDKLLTDEGGIPGTEFDTSRVTGNLRGYTIHGPEPVDESIKALMAVYNLAVRENNGKIEFVHRTAPDKVTIDANDLGTHELDSEVPWPLETEDVGKTELPGEVNLRYIDPARDWKGALARERALDRASEAVHAMEFLIALSAAEADTIVKRTLWTLWASRKLEKVTLPLSYRHIQPGDVVENVVAHGRTFDIFVLRKTRGHNGIVELEGVVEEAQTLTL